MYSLPKFTTGDFDIKMLLPQCESSDEMAKKFAVDVRDSVSRFVGKYAGEEAFRAGKTKKDLNKIARKLGEINEIMQGNKSVLRYMELKSAASLRADADVSVTNVNTFYSFFAGIEKMYHVADFYKSALEITGGRYRNSVLNINYVYFVSDLINIYECATEKRATGNYAQGGIVKDTPFVSFVNKILCIINEKFPDLNGGHGIHFSVMDVMRKIDVGKK